MRVLFLLTLLLSMTLSLGCGGKYGPAATPANPATPPKEKGSKPDLPIPTPGPGK